MLPPAFPPRRALLGLAILGCATRAMAQPAGYAFRIMREGSQIGTHHVSLTRANGGLTAVTEVAIAVRIMGITVFRFAHHFEEVWVGERLRAVTSHQDRNGRVQDMTARAEAGAVLVRGTEGEYRLPPEAAPLTWWDPKRFGRPLFDNASGKPLTVNWTRLPQPDGGVIWRAAGDADGEARYAADGRWLSWQTHGDDGSLVTYEPA
jgi:Family of unknown function (DUF6134)